MLLLRYYSCAAAAATLLISLELVVRGGGVRAESAVTDSGGLVFRATVLRELLVTAVAGATAPDNSNVLSKQYIVQVTRVYQGCSLRTRDRVLVTTRISVSGDTEASLCSMSLDTNKEYVLTAMTSQPMDHYIHATLGNHQKAGIKSTVWINLCGGFNQEWASVSLEERSILRSTEKTRCHGVWHSQEG